MIEALRHIARDTSPDGIADRAQGQDATMRKPQINSEKVMDRPAMRGSWRGCEDAATRLTLDSFLVEP